MLLALGLGVPSAAFVDVIAPSMFPVLTSDPTVAHRGSRVDRTDDLSAVALAVLAGPFSSITGLRALGLRSHVPPLTRTRGHPP
jgi:hypothetical protein